MTGYWRSRAGVGLMSVPDEDVSARDIRRGVSPRTLEFAMIISALYSYDFYKPKSREPPRSTRLEGTKK